MTLRMLWITVAIAFAALGVGVKSCTAPSSNVRAACEAMKSPDHRSRQICAEYL
jgi:hypothetical protein